jgi:tetratricopeptide (TPR) repeat protein
LAGALAIVLTATTAFAANWPFNNRRHYFIADDYVENLFDTIAPDGLLLTQDWQVVSPMFYAQEIQQHRPDVKVVDINLLRRSWYFDYLEHSHPALIDRSREKIDPYVQLLKRWERDPRVFDRNQELTRRISIAFLEMIQSMVRNEITVGPVYITNDVLSGDKTNGYLTRWIPQAYQLVPQGLVFNLTTDQSFHDSPDPHLRTRGLADGTTRFESDDVVRLKVLPVYARMLTNRGRYLASFNQHERASRAFKQALELDPDFAAARQGLAESSVKLQVP